MPAVIFIQIGRLNVICALCGQAPQSEALEAVHTTVDAPAYSALNHLLEAEARRAQEVKFDSLLRIVEVSDPGISHIHSGRITGTMILRHAALPD